MESASSEQAPRGVGRSTLTFPPASGDSDVADQISVSGVLSSGTAASVHFRGGMSRCTPFMWEINGTEGDLLTESLRGHKQVLPLRLKGARGGITKVVELPIPDSCRWIGGIESDTVPYNLAQAYRRVAHDLANGGQTAPTLGEAVVRHRMIDVIERAATSGSKASYDSTIP